MSDADSSFKRLSHQYASLPQPYRQTKQQHGSLCNAHELEAEADFTVPTNNSYKNQKSNSLKKQYSKKRGTKSQAQIQRMSHEEAQFGLSNNLSSESIRKACEIYEDGESSDENIRVVQTVPECFQKSSGNSLRRSLKARYGARKKRRSSEENPLYVMPTTANEQSMENAKADEDADALSVLNALDAVINNYEIGADEDEGKIADYLMDLDKYLDEMDDCSIKSNRAESRTASGKTGSLNNIYAANLENENTSMFKRMHALRKTISCAGAADVQVQTLQSEPNVWQRRESMRHLTNTLDNLCSNDTCSSILYMAETPSSTACEEPLQIVCESTLQQNNLSQQQPKQNQSNNQLNIEPRRCQSQRDLRNVCDEMLTQDNIYYNILAQSVSQTANDNRPRQFGRRAGLITTTANGTSSSGLRPMSAPAATVAANFIGSDASSVRSSGGNESPVSLVSTTDSSLTAVSHTAAHMGNLTPHMTQLETERTQLEANSSHGTTNSNHWPHNYSRCLALSCCCLGLFNFCRFAVLTVHYGSNFLLQFVLLSIFFGIPFFWLQMSLGAKIKSGPVSMWKISPICRGIGIALSLLQWFIAIYSTVAIAWLLIYLRDSFPSQKSNLSHCWLESMQLRQTTRNTSYNLTKCVADYFNIVVLQRFHLAKHANLTADIPFRVSDRLAFSLAVVWALVFLILSKGLKSFGKVVFLSSILPLIMLATVTVKLLLALEPDKLQSLLSSSDLDDFLINSKTWTAASQETFLTWGLLGCAVIALSSRVHTKSNKNTTLRRDAFLAVLITLLGLCLAALMGLACVQILNQHGYIYVPGSYENPDTYTSVYSLKDSININLLSFPNKWVPHYSSFIGETYRRPALLSRQESGYQALRFISELFPTAIALSNDSISWQWSTLAFGALIMLGIAQLCVMIWPISNALGNSTSAVLLSCVTGLLLGIPFATEMGIGILHFMDLVLGGAWFICILWTAQIFGVFLIRGRPYNGDDLVNDLHFCGSLSAFLALAWNVLLPIGLITLCIVEYKSSLANQFYYWRNKSYFSYWARKVAAGMQVSLLLLVPVVAIIQIYRFLSKGPADILERIQLLYRPSEELLEQQRPDHLGQQRRHNLARARNGIDAEHHLNFHNALDDAPPKYTPPPSFATATGARLAKALRQSIRRSVRRILGEAARTRPTLRLDSELHEQNQHQPPDYTTVLSNPAGTSEHHNGTAATLQNELGNSAYFQRSLSQKQRHNAAQYTAEDVVNVLRSSTRATHAMRPATRLRELHVMQTANARDVIDAAATNVLDNSFRSIENLVLNAEPLGQSVAPSQDVELTNSNLSANNRNNNTTVI